MKTTTTSMDLGEVDMAGPTAGRPEDPVAPAPLTHLRKLEAESIHIMREVVAECERPVMLYSIGKDSSVMLHLAMKAFYPSPPPFPFLHVDTTWKFKEMIAFRDETAARLGLDLRVHINPDGVAMGMDPFRYGSSVHTDVMKTQGLKQALEAGGYDAAFGGARRDEEKSRAKERVFSIRSAQHRWDPKQQRPELWSLYNARRRKGRASASSRCRTGPNSTCGSTSTSRTSRSCRSTSRAPARSFAAAAPGSWLMTSGCRSSRARRPNCARSASARSAATR
jgi:3'-phosphoadenosine 5'-phosphosulfate sulfotransferase (PAPS reductase)/FAD synthetase